MRISELHYIAARSHLITDQWVVYAKVAHIHAQQPKGERYDAAVAADPAVLHGFDNLILLCGPHHDQIDQTDAGDYYTAEMIRDWKEARVLAVTTEQDREWVFGGTTISYCHDGQQVDLRLWRTTTGEVRFYRDSTLYKLTQHATPRCGSPRSTRFCR